MNVTYNNFVLADSLVMSPRRAFIFIMEECIDKIKVYLVDTDFAAM